MKTLKRVIFLFAFTVIANSMWAGDPIFGIDFSGMVYGGDIIANRTGKIINTNATTGTPYVITDGKLYLPEGEPAITNAGATTSGPGLFDTGAPNATTGDGLKSDAYKLAKGLVGDWQGVTVRESPGYVIFGASRAVGSLLTPPLSAISGTQNVKVSFKLARNLYSLATKVATVSITGGGTLSTVEGDDTATPTTVATATGGFDFDLPDHSIWYEKELIITGATSSTRIKFESTIPNAWNPYPTDDNAGKHDFGLDDIYVETIDEIPGSNTISPAASGNDISVYVNPADGYLYFSNTEAIGKVEIIGLSGGIALEVNAPTQGVVSLSGLPSGVYIARFTTQNKGVVNKKVVK
jgi:hypothetical protein